MDTALCPIPRPATTPAAPPAPLVVELEALLAGTDLVVESLATLVKRRPWALARVPFWRAEGRAFFGHRLAEYATPDVRTLPYRRDLIAYLAAERRRGTPLVLVARADRRIADAVAAHLGLFEQVLASDARTELSGSARRDRLIAAFGARGFDYAGRDPDDPAWEAARDALPVPGPPAPMDAADRRQAFRARRPQAAIYLRALRPHHWLKNALLFVPLIAAARLFEVGLLGQTLLAFVAFGLCASSAYLLNDLLDLPSDRRHPSKRHRPLASGRLPSTHAAGLVPILLAAGVAVGSLLAPAFLAALGLYYALTLTYSLSLRDVAILDVLALAGLYTLRVAAGSAAVGMAPSAWLLVFAMLLFLGLAMLKRYGELIAAWRREGREARARAYRFQDRAGLAALGAASGCLAVLVLALAIDPATASGLALRDWRAGVVAPLLLSWIGHMWLAAHRARMPDDPLVFALKDPSSRVLIGLMSLIALIPA